MKYENIEYLDPETLDISEWNPRDGQFELEELEDSIQKNGIVEPLIVRKRQKGERKGRREVLVGGRRVVAAERLGIDEVPCIIIKCNDEKALRKSLVSNLVKKNLEPVETANAAKLMMKRFSHKYRSVSDVANELGVSAKHLLNIMKVMKAPRKVRDEITTKKKAEKGEGINLKQAIAIEEEVQSPKEWQNWIDKAKEKELTPPEIKAGIRRDRKQRKREKSEGELDDGQETLMSPIYRTKAPEEFFDILENGEIYVEESVAKGQEVNVSSKVKFEAGEVNLDKEKDKWKVELK